MSSQSNQPTYFNTRTGAMDPTTPQSLISNTGHENTVIGHTMAMVSDVTTVLSDNLQYNVSDSYTRGGYNTTGNGTLGVVTDIIPSGGDDNQNNVSVGDLEIKIIYIIIGILGVFGNGISIIVFLSSRRMRKNMTNQFLIHQNSIDLIASIFILGTIPETEQKVLKGPGGFLYCIFWNNAFLVWLILLVSAFNLVALTIERWLKITRPFFHRSYYTKKVAYVMMALAWILAITYQVALEASTSTVIDGKCYTQAVWSSDEARKALGVVSFVVKLLAPVLIIIFCYSGIILAIKKSSAIHDQNKHQEKMQKIQRNILKTLVIIVIFFILCITWNQTIFLLHNLEVIALDFTGWNFHLSIVLYFANCCVNPFIYVAKYKEFRTTLHRLFCRKRFQGPAGSEASTTTEVIDMSSI